MWAKYAVPMFTSVILAELYLSRSSTYYSPAAFAPKVKQSVIFLLYPRATRRPASTRRTSILYKRGSCQASISCQLIQHSERFLRHLRHVHLAPVFHSGSVCGKLLIVLRHLAVPAWTRGVAVYFFTAPSSG